MRIRDPYRSSRRASFLGLALVILVFVLGFGWLVLGMTERSFVADEDGSDEIPGLGGEVTMIRDRYGVPYITAASEEDAMAALGYAHAQDRLWQMDLIRRAGSGRLAEILGKAAIGFDAYARTIGFERISRQILERMPKKTRATLDAYCRGVNAFIESHHGRYPMEFDAIGYEPEAWEPVHSVMIVRLLGWEQNASLWTDVLFERLSRKLDSARYRDILPWWPSYGPTIVPGGQAPEPLLEAILKGAPEVIPADSTADSTGALPGVADTSRARRDSAARRPAAQSNASGTRPNAARPNAAQPNGSTGRPTGGGADGDNAALDVDGLIDVDLAFRRTLGMGESGLGSNAWAVSGKRTASGKPMLANDPHLAHSAPSKWYQAVLLIGERRLAGVTVPGLPFVLIGRNDEIAWGLTSMMSDETDFYLEKIDPKKDRALHDGKWEPMTVIYDTIDARDTASVPIEIRITRHGPLVSDLRDLLGRYSPPVLDPKVVGHLITPSPKGDSFGLALRWLGSNVTQELPSLQGINASRSLSEFKRSLATGGVPGLSLIYADAKGTIAYMPFGRIPIRGLTNPNGVSPGWDSRYNWRGTHEVDDLPSLTDPERGYVGCANNRISNSLSFFVGDLWEDPARAERIDDLLAEGNDLATVDFIQMQGDVISPFMRYCNGFLLRAFPDSAKQGRKVREALGILRTWNGEMAANSPEAAIAAQWFITVVRETYRDEMGDDLYRHFLSIAQLPHRALRRHLMNDSPWFDDLATNRREERDDILRNALGVALDTLHKQFGTWDIASWNYGKIHALSFHHPFTVVEPMRKVVDVGPFEIGGASTTLNNGSWDFNAPFVVRLGPSMRQIVDFADTSVFLRSVITTGQSGQPMNPRYQDQSIIWLFNGYVNLLPAPPTGNDVLSVTTLRPG